jgi:hypothetical protein
MWVDGRKVATLFYLTTVSFVAALSFPSETFLHHITVKEFELLK